MTDYIEEFCDVDGYRCLMPIEYELIEENPAKQIYWKVKCICHNVREGKCDKKCSCNHFMAAKEIIEE